jgi:multidrug efflux pump subunit AcrA (membrane-fusion protein)
MYAEVKFVLPRAHPTILVPGNALLANSQGTRVVKVDGDKRAHFVTVQVGRDMGSEIEIVSGLSGSEQVVTNPVDTLTDGQQVQVVPPASQTNEKEKRG